MVLDLSLNFITFIDKQKQLIQIQLQIMTKLFISTFTALLIFASCTQVEQEETDIDYETQAIDQAVVVMHATEGNSVEGTVAFTQTDEGVRVEADISGLEADSMHGFHIHQYGDCRASDGTSAGGHFNPEDMRHGGPDDDMRHVGDLGNLQSDADGNATADFVDSKLQLSGMTSILGRGVIIHAGEDDLESQPTGAAGSRLACGVIGVANPQ
jgi:Cu-Zn family superoxide dismutase